MNKTSFIPALIALAAASRAGVLTDSYSTVGNQDYYFGSLGLAFDVASSPLIVSGLGAFDSGLDGFAAGTTITVGIFDRSTQTLVGSSLSFTQADAGTLVGAWREKSLATPFTLAAGGQYMLVASGFGASDPVLNTGVTPGNPAAATNSEPDLLSFVGSSYFDVTNSPTFAYPTTPDQGPAIRYGAGNFSVQAVPEPASFAALGLGAVAMLRRRKRA